MTELVVKMKFGSHLYGTSTPSSDLDFKAIHVPPARDILLGRVRNTVTENTKLDNTAKNSSEDVDLENFTLQKFLLLMLQGQTVTMDMLFADKDSILESSYIWDYIQNNRHRLISRKCDAYIGYCRQQANKYGIKGSRVAAARRIVGLLEACTTLPGIGTGSKLNEIQFHVDDVADGSVEFIKYEDRLIKGQDTSVKHLSVCERLVPMTASIKQAIDIYSRLVDQYGQRALQAESNQGVDWKALSHAVRIGRQAVQILGTGELQFPLPYANHLLKIKKGELSYKAVAEEIEDLLPQVEEASAASSLREEPDKDWVDDLVRDVYGFQVYQSWPDRANPVYYELAQTHLNRIIRND